MKKMRQVINNLRKADTSTKLVLYPNICVTIAFLCYAHWNTWNYLYAMCSTLIAYAAYKDIK